MVSLIPFAGVKNDFIDLLLSREHGRQQDAVVVGMRLCADHFDLETLAITRENFIDRAHSGHAVADEEETLSLARRQVHPYMRAEPSSAAAPHVRLQRLLTPVSATSAPAASKPNTRKPGW